ncbi:sensor histidine kinase [Helicobacter sp. 23-1045]
MFRDSKKTIIKILALYLGTSAVFLCIGFYFLNVKMTQNIVYKQMAELRDTSFYILDVLRRSYIWEIALEDIKARTPIPFAIYDRRNNLLFSNLSRNPNPRELRDGFYRFEDKIIVNPLMPPQNERGQWQMRGEMGDEVRDGRGYRRSHYKIFLERDNADDEILAMRLKLGFALLAVFVAMGAVATILVHLFLKPLNEYIAALDAFIKDSTHEINTPLSVILMSIETLKTDNFTPNERKKIERIKFASLQLNSIYNSLVAYNFPRHTQKEQINLEAILRERLEFFTPFFNQKNLEIRLNLRESYINAEQNTLNSLFDNLISNAIKYNKKGGFIAIALENGTFSIENSGDLIKSENKAKIFDRYARFGTDTGGFGIGLSLVKKICDEYGIAISVESGENSNRFTLKFAEFKKAI